MVGRRRRRGFRLLVRIRAALLASLLGVSAVVAGPVVTPALAQQQPAPAAPAVLRAGGATIADIRVVGNQRIEAATIRSYMLVQPGDAFDPDRIDRSLKTLYATGLFSDVRIDREGAALVVHVSENPTVNRIAFEGNRKLNDETLRGEVQLKQRSVFTSALVQADRQRLLELYAKRGRYAARVEPKIIKLPQNRVDVVFEIKEGPITLVSRIVFVGNHAFSEKRLRQVIESREQAWYRFLSSSDEYDPERMKFDSELLRRFYLRNGYADFAVTGATAELAPDRSSFFVTFVLNEGPRYRISKVAVNSTLPHVDVAMLRSQVDISAGDWYDGDAVERNVQTLTSAVQNRGIAFVQVKPRIARNTKNNTVDLVFDVSEAPRVYIERININGNTRTEDKVIRRAITVAEGDAYNDALVRRSKQSLEDLNYFGSVDIRQTPGSAPDRTVLDTNITEKATGELTIGGGYSTEHDVTRMPLDLFESALRNNLRSFHLLVKHSVPLLEASGGGAIITVAGGWKVRQDANSAYAAAKAGLIGSAQNLARELYPKNIRVHVLAPSLVWEAFALGPIAPASRKLDRLGHAADVAYAALYLCSDEAAWVTGLVLNVDGGDHVLVHSPLRQAAVERGSP